MPFPEDFVWGAATASFQIEGGADSRGRSIWDELCDVPGAILNGDTGVTCCDHVNRYEEDIALMRNMGLRGYRFSISWPRVMPEGTGRISEDGVGFYDRLVDGLLSAGVQPWATLYHWDMPVDLYHRGGWLNPDSPGWFADYTGIIMERLSDRVTNWLTLNEPQVFISLGYGEGVHAPALKVPMRDQIRIGHNVLKAHGAAAQVIREKARATPTIGWAPFGSVFYPATDAPADVEAARGLQNGVDGKSMWNNSWLSDPVFLGEYPADGLKHHEASLPKGWERDMDLIHQPMDCCGVNIYRGTAIKAGQDGKPETVPLPVGDTRTAFGWEITPPALYWGPRFMHERYQKPIVITENGLSNRDSVSPDGKVHDPQRIDFTAKHLSEIERAIDDGVEITGYFHWSLMDNFEWAEGFLQRFGLVHVDFNTLIRTPKDSARWYAEVIRSNGASIHDHQAGTAGAAAGRAIAGC